MKKEFTIIDTAKEKVLESRKGYVELLDEYLKIVLDYKCEEINEDSAMPITKEYFNNRIMDRLSINEICLFKVLNSGNWCVEVSNGGDQLTVQYKNTEYDEAKTLFNDILAWRYPK